MGKQKLRQRIERNKNAKLCELVFSKPTQKLQHNILWISISFDFVISKSLEAGGKNPRRLTAGVSSAGVTAATNGGQRVVDVIRYRADTQPIITDPASIFLSRKSRNINIATLVVSRLRNWPQKSRRPRRRTLRTASSRPVTNAVDVGEQCPQNGRLSFGAFAARGKYAGCKVLPRVLVTDSIVL